MKVTLTHDGKSVELDLTAEQMTALGLKEEKKKTGYERVEYDERYWTVYSDGDIGSATEHADSYAIDRWNDANYYADEKLAKDNARADRLMRNLRRFAAENGGIPSVEDWDTAELKYGITCIYRHDAPNIQSYKVASARGLGEIFFNDERAANKAIEKFHDELIWYFTEYEAMLR